MSVFAGVIHEPVRIGVSADTTLYSADNATWPTADGGVLTGALDFADAEVVPVSAAVGGGGAYYPPQRPYPVVGVGVGILPELEGEAHGVVIVSGEGVGTILRFAGAAAGSAGVVGRSTAQLVVRGAALGRRGQAGHATAVLKGLSIAGNGAAVTRGSGSGVIMKLNATATGRCDAEAVIAFLLAS